MNLGFLRTTGSIRAFPGHLLRSLALSSLLFGLFAAAPAAAHDLRHGDIHIGHVWARPADAGGAAEVYFAVVNRGIRADRLVGARSAIAARAGLAETGSIELAASRPVALRPGGRHVRLDGLRQTLRLGDRFALTLVFAHAPPAEVMVFVEAGPGH